MAGEATGAGGHHAQTARYSPSTGLIYIFNLIVGTGALTLPAAFHDAGWALSSVIILLLAFMSYLTATFVIESMASANALVHLKRRQALKKSDGLVNSPSGQHSRSYQVDGYPPNFLTKQTNWVISIISTYK